MRPTKELKLKKSGCTAHIVEFFTRADDKRIGQARYTGATMKYVDGESQIEGVSMEGMDKRDDALLLAGVNKLNDASGKEIVVTRETLDNLPAQDTKVLLLELDKILSGVEEKK